MGNQEIFALEGQGFSSMTDFSIFVSNFLGTERCLTIIETAAAQDPGKLLLWK